VSVDGRDVTDSGFVVRPGTVLDVVISANGATIEGTVIDSKGKPVAYATVVDIPSVERQTRRDLYERADTDQLGHFSLRGLNPGKYTVLAFDDLQEDTHQPGFLEVYEGRGEHVQLDEGARSSVTLKLISADAEAPSALSHRPIRKCEGFSCVNGGYVVNPPHMDLLLTLAGLGDVVGSLHPHERVHLHSEGFLNAQRHVPGEVGLAVKQAGERGTRNVQRGSSSRYRQPRRLDNLRADEISGWGGFFIGIAFTPYYLVVVFQIYVADFAVCHVDAERQATVAGDAEAPCALAVAGECVHIPRRERA
jgi:hypothetical protein